MPGPQWRFPRRSTGRTRDLPSLLRPGGDWFNQLQANVAFGALDDNIDGQLTLAEFRNDPRFAPLQYFSLVDTNKDGMLSKSEFNSALQMMAKMRGAGKAPAAPATDKGAAAMLENATGKAGGTR